MNDIMEKITETTKSIQLAKEAYSIALKDAVEPTLKHIAETYGSEIDIITIIGYTPGFNDGEPCTHSLDYGFGYGFLSDYGLEYLMEDWFGDDEDKIEELMNKEVKVTQELKDFVSNVLDPYFAEKLVTDYHVTIFFENGTYRIDEDEYDCGY